MSKRKAPLFACALFVLARGVHAQSGQADNEALANGYRARDNGDLRLACEQFLTAAKSPDLKLAANANLNYAGVASSCTPGSSAEVEVGVREAYRFAIKNGSLKDASLARNNLGVRLLRDPHAYGEAVETLKKINFNGLLEAIGADQPDPGQIPLYYTNLAHAFEFHKDPQAALSAYARALAEGARWANIKGPVTVLCGKLIMDRAHYNSRPFVADVERIAFQITRLEGLPESVRFLTQFRDAAASPLWEEVVFRTVLSAAPDLEQLASLNPELESVWSAVSNRPPAQDDTTPPFLGFWQAVCVRQCGDWVTSKAPEQMSADAAMMLSRYLNRLADAFVDRRKWDLAVNRLEVAWSLDPFNLAAAHRTAGLLTVPGNQIAHREEILKRLKERYEPKQLARLIEKSRSEKWEQRGHLEPADLKLLIELYTWLDYDKDMQLQVTSKLLDLRETSVLYAAADPIPDAYHLLAECYKDTDKKLSARFYLSASREYELTGDSVKALADLDNALQLDAALRSRVRLDSLTVGQNAIALAIPEAVPSPPHVRVQVAQNGDRDAGVAEADPAPNKLFSLELPRTVWAGDAVEVFYGSAQPVKTPVLWPARLPKGGLLFQPLARDTVLRGIAPENEQAIVLVVKEAPGCVGADAPGIHSDRYPVAVDPATRQFQVRLYRSLELRDVVEVRSASGTEIFAPRSAGTGQGPQRTRYYFEAGAAFDWAGHAAALTASLRVDYALRSYADALRPLTGCTAGTRRKWLPQFQTFGGAAVRPEAFRITAGAFTSVDTAVVEAGVFAPYLLRATQWTQNGSLNALVIGPVARAGLERPLWLPGEPESQRRFSSYAAGGFRIGYFDFQDGLEGAPFEVSSAEFTLGRWKRLAAPGAALPLRAELAFTAVVPNTPMSVEFRSNFGRGRPENSISLVFLRTDLARVWRRLENETSAIHDAVDQTQWGTVQAHFLAGMAAASEGGFTGADRQRLSLMLGVQLQKSWLYSTRAHPRRVGFQTYFDGRQTEIRTQILRTTGIAAPIETVPQSGAQVVGGAYLPIRILEWSNGPYRDRFFAAPISKGTAQSPRLTPSGTPQGSINRIYYGQEHGIRLGILRSMRPIFAPPDTSPEIEVPELARSYLDLTVGRFSNFEQAGVVAPVTASGSPAVVRIQPWRLSVDGFFDVPKTLLFVEVSANFAASRQSAINGVPLAPIADEVKISFGARMSLLSRFYTAFGRR